MRDPLASLAVAGVGRFDDAGGAWAPTQVPRQFQLVYYEHLSDILQESCYRHATEEETRMNVFRQIEILDNLTR